MGIEEEVLVAKGGFLAQTYRESGLGGCIRKLHAAIKMNLPLLLMGRRTNASVGAYFDLITDDGRLFYGDSFHFGLFQNGERSLQEGLDAHTDRVAALARTGEHIQVLDLGCGICAPAIRIAGRHRCRVTGINISKEQVRQGRRLVEESGLSDRIEVREGNALRLDLPDNTFDAILCIEVAGDICVSEAQKVQLVREMHRVLRPGGCIGFSDLVFKAAPPRSDEKVMRTILYHQGRELITDWPGLFQAQGFGIEELSDVMAHTLPTWEHALSVYEDRIAEVEQRYGRRIAAFSIRQLERIPDILSRYGSFIMLRATKPLPPQAALPTQTRPA
jgi:cyclopropane fatty-acyl-phospholipid synthase-like methyltransferase